MNKIITLAGAAVMAAAFTLSAATPSMADKASDAVAAGFVGGMFGFVAGAAAASAGGSHHHHMHNSEWRQHVEDCQDEYGWRYDPDTDLVTKHHKQFYCDL